MPQEIFVLEGYDNYPKKRRTRRGTSPAQRAQQSRMAAAAKACKGRKKNAFAACVATKLKRRR